MAQLRSLIVVSIGMDVLIIAMMSLKNSFVYMIVSRECCVPHLVVAHNRLD